MPLEAAAENTEDVIRETYPELRRIAACLLRNERRDHTLQRTALVHETFIRLFGKRPGVALTARNFLPLAVHEMRRVLVDYARRHRSQKRGGGWRRVRLLEGDDTTEANNDDLLALNQALDRLGASDPRALAVVELKFFGGLTNAETAAVLGFSDASVEADWQFARVWLYRALHRITGDSQST